MTPTSIASGVLVVPGTQASPLPSTSQEKTIQRWSSRRSIPHTLNGSPKPTCRRRNYLPNPATPLQAKNGKIGAALLNLLTEAGQEVPAWFAALPECRGGGGKGGGKPKATDVRQGQAKKFVEKTAGGGGGQQGGKGGGGKGAQSAPLPRPATAPTAKGGGGKGGGGGGKGGGGKGGGGKGRGGKGGRQN